MDDFSDYMGANWPRLVRSLVMLGCPQHEAEDVVQTALMSCFRSWARVRRSHDVDAYVFRYVLNAWAKSRLRRWWGEVPSEVLPDRPGPDGASPEDRQLIHQALTPLSPAHRDVLVLRFVADLSEAQVAAVLGISPGTVKSRTHRALAAIDSLAIREDS